MRLLDAHWRLTANYLARSSKPIICGPWRSEVGFELLYWIPFLNWFRETYQIPRERLIYIGRGGSAQWFDSAGKADLFEFLPIEAVRQFTIQAAQQTGSIKQQTEERWERNVCDSAALSTGHSQYHVLSPSWMYRLLSPFWEGQQPQSWLDQRALYRVKEMAPAVPHDLERQLPAQYIAMRWYTRATWPLQEDLVLWARKLTQAVASRVPVVMIGSAIQADDHADMHLGPIPNVIHLRDYPQTPLNNLAIQSAVIAKAQGYIGTYGGLAQGAMRWGVPTLSFYHQFGQTSPNHLALSYALSLRSGVPFVATTPSSIDALLPLIPLQAPAVEASYA